MSSTAPSEHTPPQAKISAYTKFKLLVGQLRPKKQPNILFPPPSWFLADSGNITTSVGQDSSYHTVDATLQESTSEVTAPEPKTFAARLKRLIDTLPVPSGPFTAAGLLPGHQVTDKVTEEHEEELQDATAGPVVPDNVDPETVRLLSSENVMNGETEGAHERKSVWSELDKLGPGPPFVSTPPGMDTECGVMMYAPLEPPSDSEEVELASSVEYTDQESRHGKGKEAASPQTSEKKVWVPSTTSISVLTTWWGYRLYLPPPVMAKLDSSHMQATKQAAMVTAALQWFLNKVPLKILPVKIRAPVMLLRRLGPLVGYIGVFVAWSWGRIRACDQGNGVVLSATWVLPVVLVPLAWDAGDIHGPPTNPSNAAVENRSPAAHDDGTKTATF